MHVFSLTFAGSGGSCLNTKALGRVFNLLPRDPANVNALKQTCLIVILAFYMIPWKLPRDPANFNALKQTCLIIILAFYMIPWKLPSKTPEKSWTSRCEFPVHIRWRHFVLCSFWSHFARPNHCGRHLGKIHGQNSTYVKVWRYTFGRITRVLIGKSRGKLL